MSAHLQWMFIRNNSCFLVKSLGKTLSKEPYNLSNKNTFKSNGLVHTKAVSISSSADGKGIVLGIKRSKGKRKPEKLNMSTTIQSSRGGRHIIKAIKNTTKKRKYRSDLTNVAVRRACALARSQSASAVVKKKRSHRKRN